MNKRQNDSLLRGLLSVFSVNTLGLLFGLFNGFILPKFISIDTYSYIKTYQLYYFFIGVFHLGLVDAVSLKCGGLRRCEVDRNDQKQDLIVIRSLLLFEQVVFLVIAWFSHNLILIFVFLTISFSNILSYYKIFYQAIGELGNYSRIVFGMLFFKFLANVLLIFVFKIDDYQLFLLIYVLIEVAICIRIEVSERIGFFSRNINFMSRFKMGILRGAPLLAGNLVVNLLSSIDRWFVKAGRNSTEFAFYSFAVSVEQILISLTKPFQISLYSYICDRKESVDTIVLVRKIIEIMGVGLVACFFPIAAIVEVFLDKYTPAISVMGLLFASQIWNIAISTVYINLYKAKEQQKKYFLRILCVVMLAFVLDEIGFITYGKNIVFAWTTLVVNIVWFLLSIKDFEFIIPRIKELLYLLIMTCVFVFLVFLNNWILSLAVYIFIFLLMTCGLHFDVIRNIKNYLMDSK